MIRKILSVCAVLLLAACGTIATPVYDAPTATATLIPETGSEQVAIQPSATPVPPTATPVPPTEVPTEIPTQAPTEVPTQAGDPLKGIIDLSSASNGEHIFHEVDLKTEPVWRCTTCHNTESAEIKIGPSLVGILDRAATRVEGQGPYTYLYNSIRDSQAFIVPDFEFAAPMPHISGEILGDAEVYDIIAYLVTLN
jgi:cytochrome c2